MKNIYYHSTYCISIILVAIGLSGCIKNDIPYPRIQADFLSFVAEGQSGESIIDTKTMTVTANFPENTDLSKIKVKSYTITQDATVADPDLNQPIDLRTDLSVNLFLYYDYKWTIKANQQVERYFKVQDQVGTTAIDVPAKRIVAYIPKSNSLKNVLVNSIKLGPAEVSTMTPDLSGKTIDFSSPVTVEVKYFDITEQWTIYVKRSDVNISTDRVDAWTNVIWAYGTAQAGKNNGFEYRKKSETEWTKVNSEWITHNGGSFSARIIHAEANTEYEVRAYSDTDYGNAVTVTTSGKIEIPNASLDNWWEDGKIWNPWAKDGSSFWDTGNRGAATLGESNSIPSPETWNGAAGNSAMLQTKFVGIAGIGKLAAGNLFTGEFIRVDGTNGILNFGRKFSGRPTRLNGYCKYQTSPINYASSSLSALKGRPDTAVVYMALTDWEAPYEIRTNPKNQQLFNPNSPEVIAYGEVKYGNNIDTFTQFTVDLNYRATNRIPKYLLIVCTASKYGDYFTGGSSSIFYVDNLWLDWDY